jgi:hypothetical protein
VGAFGGRPCSASRYQPSITNLSTSQMDVPYPFEGCVSSPLRRPAASTVVAPHAACWEYQVDGKTWSLRVACP